MWVGKAGRMATFRTPRKSDRGKHVGLEEENVDCDTVMRLAEEAEDSGATEKGGKCGSKMLTFSEVASKKKRGRLTNQQLLSKENPGLAPAFMTKWRKEGKGTETAEGGEISDGNLESSEGEEEENIVNLIRNLGEQMSKKMDKLDNRIKNKFEGVREEIGEIKNMWKAWEDKWEEEKQEVWERLNSLEKKSKEEREGTRKEVKEMKVRLERLKKQEVKVGEGRKEGSSREEELDRKVFELNRKMDQMEREKRRNNIVIKGVIATQECGKEVVEKLLEEIGVKAEVKNVRGVGGREEENFKIWVAELGNEEQKRQVLKRKSQLRGRRERIEEDRTWKERRIRFLLEEKVWEERGKGNRVVWGREGIWVEGVKWVVKEDTGEVVKEGEGSDVDEEAGFGERKEEEGEV